MRVFVLGATGWIGGTITDALLLSHHQVSGLVRTDSAKSMLFSKGASAVQGDMEDHHVVQEAARQADAVIVASSATLDATVTSLDTLITTLQGTQKTLVYISGSSLYGDIGTLEQVTEHHFVQHLAEPAMRHTPEQIVYQANENGVHGIVVVGAGILYGRGGGATPAFLLNDATQHQAARYIGTGTQRWSSVHVEDMARLVSLAIEQQTEQRVFNAVAEALPLRDVAEAIAQATSVKQGTQSIAERVASDEWGDFWAKSLARNLWLSATNAEQHLGWKPSAPSFQDELLRGSYSAF